jgi:hypothetical protein
VDLVCEAIQDYVSELHICVPITKVDDTDQIGEAAIDHFKADVEGIRQDLVHMMEVPKLPIFHKALSAPVIVESPPVRPATPL